MDKNCYILAINPGSTSTKLAIFNKTECIFAENLQHSSSEIEKFHNIYAQKDFRTKEVFTWLKSKNIAINLFSIVVGRGGLLRPMPGGTYKVTEKLIEDLKIGYQGQHASNLGGIMAYNIGQKLGIPALIVDPVAVDELEAEARISGMPEIPRRSLVHALNIKAVTRRICSKLNKAFDDSNYVVAHLGGGISIAPVKKGRIIDVNNANEEGPFSPERVGSLPVGDVVKMCFSGKYSYEEMKKKLIGKGGLTAYLNTNDSREVNNMIEAGDKKAELILQAMAYQISKEIAAMAVVLKGEVEAVILTGGLSNNKRVVEWISERVKFIAPIEIVPGEDEMLALAEAAYRAAIGQDKIKLYEEEVFN